MPPDGNTFHGDLSNLPSFNVGGRTPFQFPGRTGTIQYQVSNVGLACEPNPPDQAGLPHG